MATSVSAQTGATVWIDTNVVLELYSHADLNNAVKDGAPGAKLEERRLMLQGTLWMALALSQQRVTSISFTHECMNAMTAQNPIDSEGADWTRLILYCLDDGKVFDGWTRLATNEAEGLPNGARDTFIANYCKENRLILISRDKGACKKARARGVTHCTPEGYAEKFLSNADAKNIFQTRMTTAGQRYIESFPMTHRRIVETNVAKFFEFYMNIIWRRTGDIEYTEQ